MSAAGRPIHATRESSGLGRKDPPRIQPATLSRRLPIPHRSVTAIAPSGYVKQLRQETSTEGHTANPYFKPLYAYSRRC